MFAPMLDWLTNFFSQSGFMPHNHCYLSKPSLVWTMFFTDLLIGMAYVAISLTLWALAKRIKIQFNFVVVCFGVFILACGLTHFMEVWTLWNPDYWWSAGVKVVTATASLGTGVYLYRLRHPIVTVAEAVKLSEQRSLDLEALTKDLERRVEERTRALSESEQRFRTVTDNAASCLFVLDRSGHPTFINPAAMRVTGYQSLDEIKGKPLHYAIHWKRPDGSRYPMEECPIDNAQVELKPVQNQEEIFCRKDGSLFPVSYSLATLEKDGELIGSVLEFRDITNQKRIEDALRQAVHARDEFLSIASHELKTPLTTLKLQTQLRQNALATGNRDLFAEERLKPMFAGDARQIDRLSRLIDDMLDIARISTGRLTIHREPVEACGMVEEVLGRHRAQLEKAGCQVTLQTCKSVVGNWDRLRIEQVVANLLTNAMKYGQGKPIEITVAKHADTARLRVRDHGMGISPANHERIFQRYERAVSANEISGLGLGLYITKQIVEMHGGSISVESELGKGATFTVELPLEGEPA